MARARSAVTGSHAASWGLVARFVTVGFPAAAYRARWWWLASAAASVILAVIVGWWVARSPVAQGRLLPSDQARQPVNQEFRSFVAPG